MFSSGKFPHDPRIGPRVHPAIHTGDSYNTVELMIQRRRLEVYVNSVRVCEPVVTDWDLVPYGSSLTIFNGQPGLARAEFDEIEFRALPANEN